jgi:PAS domain S-box-containing protein
MFNAMTNGVAVYRAVDDGEDFIFTDVNKAVERIERLPREEMIGRRVTEVFPGVRDLGLLDAMRRVWRTGEPEHCPLGFYRDQRIVGWRENFVYRLTGGEVVAVYSDETDRKQAEESLRHSEERFRTFFESAHDLMAICDLDGRPVWRNAAWERVIGEASEGDPFLAGDRVHPQDRDRSRQAWESLRAGQAAAIAAEFRFQDRRGEFIFLDLSARRAQAGDRGLICAVVRDVTERKRQEAELVRLASRDPLTGLFNRRRFEEELGRQLAEAVRYKTHGALL